MTNPTKKPRLEILFGPIASGKSTYSAKRANDGALIANDDAVVLAIHGGQYSAYEKELKGLYKGVRSQIIHTAAAIGRDVVVDSTGLTRERREHLRTLATSLDMSPGLVLFRKGRFQGAADGRRRFKADPRGISKEEWIKIGEHHAKTHDPLTVEELAIYDFVVEVNWRSKC